MKKINKKHLSAWLLFSFCIFSLFLCLSCDDGKIYPEDSPEEGGGKATMQVVFKGQEVWPSSYMLIFAAFGEDAEMPVMSKIISKPTAEDEEVVVTLNGLDERMTRLSIAVVNKGRELVYAYYTYPIENHAEEITLPVSEINLASYNRIQQQVFDSYCIRCHGAGSSAAADLNLTKELSPASLINIPSVLSESGESLISPGDAQKSFLIKILKEDIIQYNHMDVLPEEELITLIEAWTDNGAEED